MNADTLSSEAILHNLRVVAVPRHVLYFSQISSTMDVAREQVRQQPPGHFPLLVVADEQTAGRGRMQRPWVSPPGGALLFSLALRPQWHLPPADAMMLVWLAGVSLCEAIAAVTPLEPRLKWPNDLLLPDSTGRLHKIAGILLESGSSSAQLDWAVIGCGLNVGASPPPDPSLRYPATSLQAALGHPVPRLLLLRAILERMDDWYTRLQAGGRDDLYATWRGLLATLGQPVHIALNEGTLSGTAEDVDTSGALHVRDEAGTLHVVTNGDVSG